MSKNIKVTKNLKGLERQIKNLKNLDMDAIGFRTLELNLDQIAKKQNKDGSRFKPYNKQYASRKRVGVGAVDLTSKGSAVSDKSKPYGTMIKSFTVIKSQRNRVEVGFRGVAEKEKAHWNVVMKKYPHKKRPFVGLTGRNERKLHKFAFIKISMGTY